MINYPICLLALLANFLAVSSSEVGDVLTQFQSGSDKSTQTSPLSSPGTRQSKVSFDRSYGSTPAVLIYISSISAYKSTYQDYKIYTSDISTDSFTINYVTTKPGNTLMFAVNWVAFEKNDDLAEVIYSDITTTTNLQDTSLGATFHADSLVLSYVNTYSSIPNVSLFLLGITSLFLSSDTIDFSSTGSTITQTTIGMTIWNSSLVSAVSFIALICKPTVCSSSSGTHTNRAGTSIITTDVWQNTSAASRTVQDTQTISTALSQPSISSASTQTFSGITGYDVRLNYLLNLEITSAVFAFPTATQQAKTWGTSTVVTGFWNSVNCYSTPKSISDLNFHLTWWQIILIVIGSCIFIAIVVYSIRKYLKSRDAKCMIMQEQLRQQELQSQLKLQKQKDSIIMKLTGQGDNSNNYSQTKYNIKPIATSPSNNLISELTGKHDGTQKSNLLNNKSAQKVTPIQTNRLAKQQLKQEQQEFSPNQQQIHNQQLRKLIGDDSIEYSNSHNNNNFDMNTSIQQPQDLSQLNASGNFQNNPNDSKLPFSTKYNNPFVDASDDYYIQQPQQQQEYNKTIKSIDNNTRTNPQYNTINSKQSNLKQTNNNSISNDSNVGNNFTNNKQRFSNNAEYSFGIANNPNNSLSFQPNRLNSNNINDSQSLNSNRIEDQSYSQRLQQQQQQQVQDIPKDQAPKYNENYTEEIIEDSQEYDYRQSPNKSNKFNTPSNRFTSPTNLRLFTSPNNNNSNNFTSPTNLFTGSSHPRLIDLNQDSENKDNNAPFDLENTRNNNSNYSRFQQQQDDGITSGNFGGAAFNGNNNNNNISGLRDGQFNQYPSGRGVNNLHLYNMNAGQDRSRLGQFGSMVLQNKGRIGSPDNKRIL